MSGDVGGPLDAVVAHLVDEVEQALLVEGRLPSPPTRTGCTQGTTTDFKAVCHWAFFNFTQSSKTNFPQATALKLVPGRPPGRTVSPRSAPAPCRAACPAQCVLSIFNLANRRVCVSSRLRWISVQTISIMFAIGAQLNRMHRNPRLREYGPDASSKQKSPYR